VLSVPDHFLGLGLATMGLGIILLLLSLRPRNDEERVEHRAAGVIFMGPIPIVFIGKGKWILFGVAVTAMIMLLIVVAMIGQTS